MDFPPLFTGMPQHEFFPRYRERYPSVAMARSADPVPFPNGSPVELPQAFECAGDTVDTAEFLLRTDTVALLVLNNGEIRHEQYALTGGRDVHWISWSVAKSFVSALIGIAIADGHISGVHEPVRRYAPALAGSAYGAVRIKDVLQMSSGARWMEDYSDPTSDVHRLTVAMNGQMTLDDFVAGIGPEHEPGTLCRYNSADTQALGMVLRGATGRSLADYMEDKLVGPLGFESAGYWLTDATGVEMAFGGLMLTAHDFARLGELYRLGGFWQGRQVVPAGWVRDSVTADSPHVQPGAAMIADDELTDGYGYQWWLYDGPRGDYSAIGIYNQFVHVDPPSGTVVVKLSANRRYGTTPGEQSDREHESRDFFRAIAARFD